MIAAQTKTCTKCGETKRLDDFHRNSARRDGHVSLCKPCAIAKAHEWVAQNKDRHATVCAAYRAAHPKTKRKEAVLARLLLTEKRCTRCTEVKSIEEFSFTSVARGKKRLAVCRACDAELWRVWASQNPDKRRCHGQRYYKNHPERFAKYAPRANTLRRARMAGAPEKYACVRRAYRERNRDQIKQKQAAWKKVNRAHCTALQQMRQAEKLRATPKWANEFFIEEIYDLARLRTKHTGIEWQVDHIVPLRSKKVCGLHWEGNLRVVPKKVNLQKNNRYWPHMPEPLGAVAANQTPQHIFQ